MKNITTVAKIIALVHLFFLVLKILLTFSKFTVQNNYQGPSKVTL